MPVGSYLLSPLVKNGSRFQDAPLSTDSINKQLQQHMRRLGLFDGESSHGLRRGTVIHDHQVLDKTPFECGMRLQHVAPGGPQTLQYLDTSRETGAPARQRMRVA